MKKKPHQNQDYANSKKKLSLPEVFPLQAKNLVKNQNNPIITDAVKFIILILGGSARL